MNCPKCGSDNRESDAYCDKCGQGLIPDTAQGPRYADHATRFRRDAVVLVVLTLLIVGASVGAWYVLFYRTSPGAVVRRFIAAETAGDYATVRSLLSSKTDPELTLSVARAMRNELGVSPFAGCRNDSSETRNDEAWMYLYLDATMWRKPAITNSYSPTTSSQLLAVRLTYEGRGWRIDGKETYSRLAVGIGAEGYPEIAKLSRILDLPQPTSPTEH